MSNIIQFPKNQVSYSKDTIEVVAIPIKKKTIKKVEKVEFGFLIVWGFVAMVGVFGVVQYVRQIDTENCAKEYGHMEYSFLTGDVCRYSININDNK